MSSVVPPPAPFTVNSDSPSNGKVVAASGSRSRAGGLYLPSQQAVSIPGNLKHEILIIPSSSTPAWGSFFTIDIREKNILLNNITLQFSTSPITGTSVVGSLAPAFFWFQRIEIVQNGNVIDTVYGNQQFLLNQLTEWDEDRLAVNNAAGNYASVAQRTLLSSSITNNVVYANLKTYFDQTKLAILTDQHAIQLRVYMDTFTNAFTLTSGSSPVSLMQSCNAICKITRLDSPSATLRLADMTAQNYHSIFHDLHYATFTVPAGNLSSTIILAPVVGNVATMFFTIRASVIGSNQWVYLPLSSFALLDSASTNIVGGQVLPASLCANILNMGWCKSSYNTETAFGSNNQNANIYMWSFSADPVAALSQGQCLTSRKFYGQEQLQLNFASALGSQVQVDVYAMVESVLEQTPSSVKKISM
jgi:hypothetical protein